MALPRNLGLTLGICGSLRNQCNGSRRSAKDVPISIKKEFLPGPMDYPYTTYYLDIDHFHIWITLTFPWPVALNNGLYPPSFLDIYAFSQ